MSDGQAALIAALLSIEQTSDPGEALARGLTLLLDYAECSAGVGVWFQAEELDLIVTTGGIEGSAPVDLRESCYRWCRTATGPALVSMGEISDPRCRQVCQWLAYDRLLVIPLGGGEALKGCLIGNASGQECLAEPLRESLRRAGEVLGIAVACVGLRSRVRRQMRLTQTLFDVSQAVTTTADLDELLHYVVTVAVRTIENAENCVLHMLDEPTGELKPRALSYLGEPPANEGRSHMRLGEGAAGRALLHRQVVNVWDVTKDARFVPVAEGRHFASMLVAPIILGERRIGALSVDSPHKGAFFRDDERLLLTLASHAAVAIENARLMHDLQASIAELTAMQEQLVEGEKLSAVGRLIAGVTHELNNPLAAVVGYAQLLQTGDALDAESRHDVERIYAQAQRAAKIVRNLQLFARQEPVVRQLVDLTALVSSALDLQATKIRLDRIKVETQFHPQPLAVVGDHNQLQQVFFHLISNAHDAMVEFRGEGRLRLSTELSEGMARVCIADDGPGIAPEVRPHIFDPFFSTKEVGLGTGLGLSVCYGIVTGHGGRIYAQGGPGEGATFVVELPTAL
jgi:signal transduction histidine kinase